MDGIEIEVCPLVPKVVVYPLELWVIGFGDKVYLHDRMTLACGEELAKIGRPDPVCLARIPAGRGLVLARHG
ncbi:MAG: hypothetical protein M3548_19950 [Actinomycetota bacterium]|nr:hypothetical protein [Actinomycetota bacterium]